MQKENIIFATPTLPIKIRTRWISKNVLTRGIHFHNEVELVYINEGDMLCYINDETVSLSAGNIILINNGVMHKLEGKSSANITYMQINIDDFLRASDLDQESQIYYIIKTSQSENCLISNETGELFDIFKKLMTELDKKELGYQVYMKSYITQLVGFMYRHKLLMEVAEFCNVNKLNKIMPSLRYIDENYAQELTLAEIAEKSNCDKYSFCRNFKHTVGITTFEYINLVRIRNAEKQLISTKKTISEIAFDCGFASVQYFNRAFKRYRGCTPGTYQKNYSKVLL